MVSVVKGLNGFQICKLDDLKPDDAVADVKTKIQTLTKLPSQSLMIGINGKCTRDNEPISTYNWNPGDPIIVVVSCAGEDTIIAQGGPKKSAQQCDCCGKHSPFTEYAYLQIESYAEKHRKLSQRARIVSKRWVPLPSSTKVHSYCSCNALIPKHRSNKNASQLLRSSLKCSRKDAVDGWTPRSALSDNSDSTAASASDCRRVRFCDEPVPNSDVRLRGSVKLASGTSAPLAEWIYIDRDICGFSLQEYAPSEPFFKEFASSAYAHEFLEELSTLEAVCAYEQHKARMNEAVSKQSYYRFIQEELELDEALKLAGVSQAVLLRAAAK